MEYESLKELLRAEKRKEKKLPKRRKNERNIQR